MIYQLARTSPLLTGQVKLNMILNGTTVDNLYYVPLSKHIAFNYNLPDETFNYTHEENVRMLYGKTKDTFFKDVHNPKLSETALYRSPGDWFCDTHDGSYEMSLRRLEYNRYKKQFEFFCPVWCDNIDEFKNIVFYLTIANNSGKRLFRKRIDTNKVKDYFVKFYKKTTDKTENKDLIYIDLKNCEAHIKGLNVETGNLQTVDISYITSTLTSCERTVMETDSLIASSFSANKIISTQLYNFAFCFNLEDFVPLYLINEISGDFINAFVDVFVNKGTEENENLVQCEMKDLYTNYEFIPKYDIFKTDYTDLNVLDYMKDYNSVDLVTKNKITQGIFHWSLERNKNEIFNLYNGFSPVNNGSLSCSCISNSITDMYTDTFDINKNPFGLFKWKNISDIRTTQMNKFYTELNNINNYFSVNLDEDYLKSNETQLFGNIIIDNTKLYDVINTYKENIDTIKNYTNYSSDDTIGSLYIKMLADYILYPVYPEKNESIYVNNLKDCDVLTCVNFKQSEYKITRRNLLSFLIVSKTYADVSKLYVSVFFINKNFTIDNISVLLPEWYIVPMEDLLYYPSSNTPRCRRFSSNSFIAIRFANGNLYITFLTNNTDDSYIQSIFFRSLYSYDPVAHDAHLFCDNESLQYTPININTTKRKGAYYKRFAKSNKQNKYVQHSFQVGRGSSRSGKNKYSRTDKNENNEYSVKNSNITGCVIENIQDVVYNAYSFLCDIIKCALLPNIVTFKKSLTASLTKSPRILSKELSFKRFVTNMALQRYDGNILPTFVDLDSVFYNNTYWNKQYQKTIFNHIMRIGKYDPNNISKFVDLSETKFSPIYRSIGYFCIENEKVDYNKFYLDAYDETHTTKYNYDGEKSWYKTNSILFLPAVFEDEIVKNANEQPTRDDIINCILKHVEKHIQTIDEKNRKEWIEKWVYDLYQYEYEYDYISDTDVSKLKFKITFNLK